MRLSTFRICRSDFLRYLRCIYGVSYTVEALIHNGLRGAFTVFTVFWYIHLYIEHIFYQNYRKNITCSRT